MALGRERWVSRAGGHSGQSGRSLDVWVWDFGLYPESVGVLDGF